MASTLPTGFIGTTRLPLRSREEGRGKASCNLFYVYKRFNGICSICIFFPSFAPEAIFWLLLSLQGKVWTSTFLERSPTSALLFDQLIDLCLQGTISSNIWSKTESEICRCVSTHMTVTKMFLKVRKGRLWSCSSRLLNSTGPLLGVWVYMGPGWRGGRGRGWGWGWGWGLIRCWAVMTNHWIERLSLWGWFAILAH